MKNKKRLRFRTLVLMTVLGTVIFCLKEGMASLPNIEPVSLLVMLAGVCIGLPGLGAVYVFVVLELLVHGLALWNVFYLYVWAILFFAAYFMRPIKKVWPFVLLNTVFGLAFGGFCALPLIFISGPAGAFSWWLAGLPFDLLHGAGNFVMALLLFQPLRKVFDRLEKGE